MHQISIAWAFLGYKWAFNSMSKVLEMKSGYNVLCTFIYIANCIVSGEIYTASKNFTLPPGVTEVTNSTSGCSLYTCKVLYLIFCMYTDCYHACECSFGRPVRVRVPVNSSCYLST